MFDSLRNKISKVQDEISASFRGLTVGDPAPPKVGTPDVHTGAELLAKYQLQWEEIHKMTETNARLAQKLDRDIERIQIEMKRRTKLTAQLTSSISSIPKIIMSTETVVNHIGDLRQEINAIEKQLIELEDLIEQEELHTRKQEAGSYLQSYQQDKFNQLDLIQGTLSSMHLEKIKLIETDADLQKQAKRQLYEKKFKHDIEEYKRTGVLPHPDEKGQSLLNLDDIDLFESNEDLEKLLQEDTSEVLLKGDKGDDGDKDGKSLEVGETSDNNNLLS